MTDAPLILVSNDDGVRAAGNVALREALLEVGQVVTVAPEREMSAGSHSITLDRPLRHRKIADDVHAIDGTPADCVYIALFHPGLLPRRPDLIVSGINHGPNLGSDIYYSGTVAAAREGALRGIPAMAISLAAQADIVEVAKLSRELVARMLEATPPPDGTVLLNVNVPGGVPRGVRATRLGLRRYREEVMARQDPRGREYLWIGGAPHHEPLDGSDTEAIDEGYVSVTPLLLQGTSVEHMGFAAFVAGPKGETP